MLTLSLTTAAAFLPIFLAESSTGEYTAPLFKVVTITLLSFWILSLTMIPFLCVFFLKVKAEKKGFDSKYYRLYRRSLEGLLKHPVISLFVVSIIFIITMQGFRVVPKIFFPPGDKAIYTAEIELPIGTPIEYTEKVVKRIERFMKTELVAKDDRKEGITNWATFIGQRGPKIPPFLFPKADGS